MSTALNRKNDTEGIAGALLKALATLAVAGGATAVVVGGASAATTAAGVAGAGVAAYAAAETIEESDAIILPHHHTSTTVVYDNYLESFTITTSHTGGSHNNFVASNNTATDPAIAQALANYHDMKGLMQNLGFIQIEHDTEVSSPERYGCPTAKMSRRPTFSR